ncbi:MAG: hypothetical protein IH945_01995 [Armatimonadetes bacterium]|nr:hypothetical protein [Armatimonadota bacterium]
MSKLRNVLALFGLVALIAALGCAKEESEAGTDTGDATGQVQTEGGGPDDVETLELTGGGDGQSR